MAKASMHIIYYLFLLTFCIDEGDGRWKKTDREILQRDIKLYKKIAERVEHELQEYYDEYPDSKKQFYANKNIYEAYKNAHKINAEIKAQKDIIKKENPLLSKPIKSTNDIPSYKNSISNVSVSSEGNVKNNTVEKYVGSKSKWPKFEDILLAMGKKYDWKNDRWIKVKEKVKNKVNVGKIDNSIVFHEKHHFSYRRIKLNRGKNKRNIVIAVTAVR